MKNHHIPTQFAPAERVDKNVVSQQYNYFSEICYIDTFSNSIPDIILILNNMKLLTQRYLQGDVSFSSFEDKGTKFYARYPLEPKLLDQQKKVA